MNVLVDSIGRSGDGRGPETAWFVVSGQEEYIFLQLNVGVVAKSQSLIPHNGHVYDRLEVVNPKTNESRFVWFNTDVDMGIYKPASQGAGAIQPSFSSEKVAPPPVAPPQDMLLAQARVVRSGNFHLAQWGGAVVWGILYSVDGTYEVRHDEVIVSVQSGSASISDSRPADEVKQLSNLQFGVCYQSSNNGSWNIWPHGPGSVLVPLNDVTLKHGDTYQFSPTTVRVPLPGTPLPRANWLCSQLWDAKGSYPAHDADTRPLVSVEATPANGDSQPTAADRPVFDELEGATVGVSHGIGWVPALGEHGAAFSARDSSRIEYPGMIPREGTLELWIKVDSGYYYHDFNFNANQDHAMIFSTDVHGGDVTWPGTTKLVVLRNGDVSLFIATSKYNRPAALLTEAHGTKFRFGEWHAIGISYGSQGQFIMVDGTVVASAPDRTQGLGSAGNHQSPLDVPTIGETVSHFWAPHQYEGGFEGKVARVRVSPKQQDWDLARSIGK